MWACCHLPVSRLALELWWGTYELVTKPFPMPRRLRITWQILRKKVLDIDPWFPMMLLVALDYLVLHMPMVVILRNVGWLALLWVALGVVKEVTSASETPTELASNADPAGLLRADRRAELTSLAAALAKVGRMWLWAGSVFAIVDGMRVVLGMLVILLLGGAGGAWACYLETRLRLAILARLPWRTISFLDDAYRRGVLRQTGAAYRFRHIRLQQQLADEYQPWPRSLLPIVMWTHVQLVRLRGFYPFLFPESVSGTLNANGKAVDAEEFTATIERRAGRRSLAAAVVIMVAVGLLFIASSLLAPRGWPSVLLFFLLFLPGCLLLIIAVKTFDTFRAVAALPTDSWTVHAAPNVIEITRGPRQVSLTVADIELIAVRPLGNSWWSYAVQAKLQSSAISAGEEPGDWLPLFWTPGLTAKIPAPLISALRSFADGRMEQKLATWLKSRETSSTYEASGTVEVKSIPATIGPVRFAGLFAALSLTFTFLLTHQTYLATIGIVADVTFIGSWYYPLSRRAVKRKLPCGTWLLRVDPNSIEVIRADDTTRLAPTDIERIELRPIGSGPGKRAVYAQLRPEAVTRLHLSESWFLLYWTPRFTSAVPSDLVQSLAMFAAGHLVGTLKEMSESEPSTPDPRAPIKRRKLREQNTGDNGARVAN
jgi:hypothetical protein